MTSLVKAIQERLAKICDTISREHMRGGADNADGSGICESIGAGDCAAAIRAADLSDLEPKRASEVQVEWSNVDLGKYYYFSGSQMATPETPTPRTDALHDLWYGKQATRVPDHCESLNIQSVWGLSRQLERELAALTARLEAAEGKWDAMQRNIPHHYIFKQCAIHYGWPISILWRDGTYIRPHIEEVCPNCKQVEIDATLKEQE